MDQAGHKYTAGQQDRPRDEQPGHHVPARLPARWVKGATADGRSVAAPPAQLLPGSAYGRAGINQPLILMWAICLLTIAGISLNKLRVLGRVMSALLLLVTGLLGCLILVMWFGTDHQGCSDNYNLLWALPTNVVLAFSKLKGRGRYALIAMALIFVSFILHITKVQQLPFAELSPLLLALLFVYGMIYKRAKTNDTI